MRNTPNTMFDEDDLIGVGVFHDKEYFEKHGYNGALKFLKEHNLAGAPAKVYTDTHGFKSVLGQTVYTYYFSDMYTPEEGYELFPEVFI